MPGLTYDTGALLAAERGDPRMWSLHRRALSRGTTPVVPAGVLVESWRSHPSMARLLKGCRIEDLDESRALGAAALHARVPQAGAVDATVVRGALARGEVVVTSDRADLLLLADAAGRRLPVIDV